MPKREYFYTFLYILFLITFILWLPKPYLSPEARAYIWIVGVIAVWRYSWFVYNALRGVFYKKYYFPKLREKAQKLDRRSLPERAFILVTTYRIPEEISIEVYKGAIKEVINCTRKGIKTTLIASVVEKNEERLVRQLWKVLSPPEDAELIITRFAGTGKRDGLAVAFRAMMKYAGKLKNSIVALVDGDSALTEDSIYKCAELFALEPTLGAVTTDEEVALRPKNLVQKLYQIWYKLRFAQRDNYMASTSLSWKVMTLTGRFSVFRGEIFLDPEFVKTVQYDFIEHWRIGWLRLLTGDDKSTWYYLLKNGWKMLYVPDVLIYSYEAPPSENFLKGATMLMIRWSGNSLRATYRVKKFSPSITSWFVWYMIRDQRITMWTGLYGLTAAILGEIHWGGGVFIAYIWWILFTRFIIILFFGFQRGYYHILWIPLVYFNQIYGSLVKIYIINHLYRQKWTRQGTILAGRETKWDRIFIISSSNLTLLSQILFFIIATGYSVGMFNLYDLRNLLQVLKLIQP